MQHMRDHDQGTQELGTSLQEDRQAGVRHMLLRMRTQLQKLGIMAMRLRI